MKKTKWSLAAITVFVTAVLGMAAAAKSQNANANLNGGNGSGSAGGVVQNTDQGNSAKNNAGSSNGQKSNNSNSGRQGNIQNEQEPYNLNDTPDPAIMGNANPVANPMPTASGKNFGQDTAAAHRSIVAKTVLNLIGISERDTVIGPQIRVIAQEQNQDELVTEPAIQKVETRGKIKTFLIGSDYKNLGALRSQYVHTRNRINQLTNLMNKTTDETVKAALATQIQALNTDMTNLNKFITDNENHFSLFGWFFKLFTPFTPAIPPEATPVVPVPVPVPNNTAPQIP